LEKITIAKSKLSNKQETEDTISIKSLEEEISEKGWLHEACTNETARYQERAKQCKTDIWAFK